MMTERIYHKSDLMHGVCEWCGEESNEIIINEGVCVDCMEERLFYEETMKGV